MDKIRFIGDLHGRYQSYLKIIEDADVKGIPTVQIGDFGVGFGPTPYETVGLDPVKHQFIRGNHDYPNLCLEMPGFISDGSYSHDNRILYVGGASSIDRMYRTEGVNWWADEQLTIAELEDILELAWNYLPEVVISHECPEFISDVICQVLRKPKYNDDNRTRMMLQQLYHLDVASKPKLHIFGHWHHDCDFRINGTRFICLNELSYIDIDIDNPFEGEIEKYHLTHTYEYSNS